jgi:hypothetical protein
MSNLFPKQLAAINNDKDILPSRSFSSISIFGILVAQEG